MLRSLCKFPLGFFKPTLHSGTKMSFLSKCTTIVDSVRQSLRHYNLLVLKKANAQSHAIFWCLCHQSGITRSVLTVTISA